MFISVLYCMWFTLSEPGGAGMGKMEFSKFGQLEIEEDSSHNIYAVCPRTVKVS